MKKKGFTLPEVLVVIAVLALLGTLILTIFTRTLRGNNKSQILIAIKQNGQIVIDQLDKIIREADKITCTDSANQTIVLEKNGEYTRIRITPYNSTRPDLNGKIEQDSPKSPKSAESSYGTTDKPVTSFENNVCADPMGTDSKSPVISITDTNASSGVSIIGGSFTKTRSPGYKEVVSIKLTIGPGANALVSARGQIDPVSFETTIQVR